MELQMKKMTALALIPFCLVFVSTPVLGKCKSWDAWAWPPAGKIPPDCHILVEGSGAYERVVATSESRKPRLKSEEHEVELELVEHYIGDKQVAQVLLRPKEKLKNGKIYWLTINGIDEGFTYYDEKGKEKRQEWIVTEPSDNDRPIWMAEPKVVDSRRIQYGCGPSVEVDLAIKIAKSEPIMALVELHLAGLDTSKRVYIIPVNKDIVTIGHGMCSGPFVFLNGKAYTAELTLVDRSGNRSDRRKLSKAFQAP
jgi:hypothetical protein